MNNLEILDIATCFMVKEGSAGVSGVGRLLNIPPRLS